MPFAFENTDRSKPSANKGIYQLKEEDHWKMKYDSLLAGLNKSHVPQNFICNQVCDYCYEIGHFGQHCPSL